MSKSSPRGQRLAWAIGFIGASCWAPVLAAVLIYMGDVMGAGYALASYGLCLVALVLLPPWRAPHTKLRLIYLVSLAPIALTAGVILWRMDILFGEELPSVVWWQMLFIIPVLLIPAITLGNKTWDEITRTTSHN